MSDGLLQTTGEDAAAELLRSLGYDVVCRNWRRKMGELDIVALDGTTLVFVEVKTRATDRFLDPVLAVGPRKQQQIRRLAEAFIAFERPRFDGCRFDVVGVVMGHAGPEFRHLTSAF